MVIPTFDRLRYLREAVASVLAQTYGAWELLVVDDGSTDGTAAWLATLADPRVRVLAMPHTANPALLRNAGVRASKGELIAFLDSDDRWHPSKLAVQVAGFAAEPSCRWRYCGFERVDPDGGEPPPARPWAAPRGGFVLERLIRVEVAIPTPTVMVERTLFDEVGGFDDSLRYVEDYDLWFRLAARSPVGVDAKPLASVGVLAATYSSDRAAVNRAWMDVYEKAARGAGPALARLCRRRRLEHLVLVARIEAAQGAPVRALRRLASQAHRGWRHADWWRAVGAAAARAALPGRTLERYRARQRRDAGRRMSTP